MFDELYLEPDEEVTSAIDKIKKAKRDAVVLCLPRNSVLGQSIVNLKLIFKQAAQEDKVVALVSPDKVTRSLAEKIGFPTFSAVDEVELHAPAKPAAKPVKALATTSTQDEPAETTHKQMAQKEELKAKTDESEDTADDEKPSEADDLAEIGFSSQAVSAAAKADHEPDDSAPTKTAARVADDNSAPDDMPIDNQREVADAEPAPKPEDTEVEPIAEPTDEALDEPIARPRTKAEPAMIPTRGNLRFYRQPKKKNRWPLYAGLALIVIGLAVASLLLPKATVAITVAAQPFNETVSSSVDTTATSVNVDTATVPGKIVSIDHQTKVSAKATGQKDIGNKATGTVTVYNEWDSSSHTFSAGTTLTTSGLSFVTMADVTVPGAASTISAGALTLIPGKQDVAVQAAAAGTASNVGASNFTIPSLPKAEQSKIYAKSTATFSGGTSQLVTVVTQSDLDKLAANAKSLNQTDGITALKQQAAGAVVLDKAIQVDKQDVAYSTAVDSVADSVEATVNGTFHVITFSQDDEKTLVTQLLASKIPDGQQLVTSGDGVSIDTSQFDLNVVSDTHLDLTNNLKAFTVTKFDATLIRRALIGTSPSSSESTVNKYVPTQAVTTQVSPHSWPRLPFLGKNITLNFTYVAASPSPAPTTNQ